MIKSCDKLQEFLLVMSSLTFHVGTQLLGTSTGEQSEALADATW